MTKVISPKLKAYVDACGLAIHSNPPCRNPAYQTDPVAMWRYYMRGFGYGLADFDDDEVLSMVGTLYGDWFIRCEFNGTKIPDVDAKKFVGWILKARDEGRADAQTKHIETNSGNDPKCEVDPEPQPAQQIPLFAQ